MLSMIDAKNRAQKNLQDAAGLEFETPTGATGTILPNLSERGKLQAVLTCTEAGCAETHVREISDWHQCGKCRTHKKSKSKGSGSSSGVSSSGAVRQMKILDTDSPEVRAKKEEHNRLAAELEALAETEREEAKKKAAEEKAAKAAADKEARELKKIEDQKAAMAKNLENAIKLSEKTGAKLSAALIARAEEAGLNVPDSVRP